MLRKINDCYLERNVAYLKEKSLHKKTAQNDKPSGSEHTPAGLPFWGVDNDTEMARGIRLDAVQMRGGERK